MYGDSMTQFQMWNLVAGVLLPILVALVTKANMSSRLRSITLLALTLVSGVLNEWLSTSGGFDWQHAIWASVTTFIIGVATLYGLWKPTGVSDAAKASGVK